MTGAADRSSTRRGSSTRHGGIALTREDLVCEEAGMACMAKAFLSRFRSASGLRSECSHILNTRQPVEHSAAVSALSRRLFAFAFFVQKAVFDVGIR
jgi:hypothetical protein